MVKDKVFYANDIAQEEVNRIIWEGLSDLFDVRLVGSLTSDLVKKLIGDDSRFGLLTHFPYGLKGVSKLFSENDFYAGVAELMRNLRVGVPDLPIVVYTGAGCCSNEPSEAMKSFIIGAGANDVVFKYEPEKDVREIREKMSELLEKV